MLGSEQERALRRAADAAVRVTAEEVTPSGGERAGQVAMVISEVFADPAKSNRVGVYAEVPDMEAFQQAMQSAIVAESMQQDGVHVDTFQLLVEAAGHL